MIIDRAKFSSILFSHVSKVVPGIGTFLDIYLEHRPSDEEFQIWLYMCDWAITKDGNELVSSDVGSDIVEFNFEELFKPKIIILEIAVVDDDELHLVFSNGIVVEIWANKSSYGSGVELISLFKNGRFISTILTD